MKKIIYLLVALVLFIPVYAKAITPSDALTHLEVQSNGGTPFTLNGRTTFNFTLYGETQSVNIVATPASESYVVEGAGQQEVQEGANTYTVKVTNPADSSSVTYTVNVNYVHDASYNVSSSTSNDSVNYEKGSSTTKNPETGVFTNILAIIAIGLASIIGIKLLNKKLKFFRI